MSELPEEFELLLQAERKRSEMSNAEVDGAWDTFRPRLASVAGSTGSPTAGPRGAVPPVRWIKFGAAMLASFGVGVLTGGLLLQREVHVVVTPSPVRVIEVAPSAAPVDEVLDAGSPPPVHADAAAPLASASGSKPPLLSRSDASADLADERALIEGARTALLRGRAADAWTLLARHETTFPRGQFAEDRDFMVVSALSGMGRRDEARTRARAFLARYPKSALRKTVEPLAE